MREREKKSLLEVTDTMCMNFMGREGTQNYTDRCRISAWFHPSVTFHRSSDPTVQWLMTPDSTQRWSLDARSYHFAADVELLEMYDPDQKAHWFAGVILGDVSHHYPRCWGCFWNVTLTFGLKRDMFLQLRTWDGWGPMFVCVSWQNCCLKWLTHSLSCKTSSGRFDWKKKKN